MIVVTYLQLLHLQIYNNSELSFEIFPVPQYPIFVAVDDKIRTLIIIELIVIMNLNINHY